MNPKFGDVLNNKYASDDNPQKIGIFVRKIKNTGKINKGVFCELTDGNGSFWMLPESSLETVSKSNNIWSCND